MIISLGSDRDQQVHKKYQGDTPFSRESRFYYFDDYSYYGMLSQHSNLHLLAYYHGSTVGHRAGIPKFTPGELACWLQESVLPIGYSGKLFLSTNHPAQDYVDHLKSTLGGGYEDRVFNIVFSPEELGLV